MRVGHGERAEAPHSRRLGFFCATKKYFGLTDVSVSEGEVRSSANARSHSAMPWVARLVEIERCPSTSAPWRGRAPATAPWSASLLPPQGSRGHRSDTPPLRTLDLRHSEKCVDIVGIERQGAFEKIARERQIFARKSLIEAGYTLKIEIHRIGMWCPFRASRLGGDKLRRVHWQAARRSHPACRRGRPPACRSARPRDGCRSRRR